ncbi:CRTAC1 family protein [Roseivirga sp.]|uniref:CRTAC1 family protein n=1 Tax=Roseivirga sp. TaxID=1964215 RepID=UPI003B8B0558
MKLKRLKIVVLILISTINLIHAQIGFSDLSVQSGIDNLGSNHGISFGDINNDGLEDIYISVRESGIPNKLYLNRGNFIFEEIAESAGVNSTGNTTAATWGDVNNDGFLDLYIGNTNTPNTLYINNGDLTFRDITMTAGVGDPFDPRSVQFADVDNDGYLDIYIHNYNTENVLYKNNQDNTFSDVTTESGALNIDPAMGTIFFDLDDDGDLDLYMLNDGGDAVLFENDGTGKFEDITEGSGLGIFCACMGVDFGDYDLDGDWDIYISNYGVNYFFENNGDKTFTSKGSDYDLNDSGMGWGTFWFDYDNDGDQDIYLANHQFISSKPNKLYQNNGGSDFEWISADTNIESPYASFGTAAADVNNDGNMDIVVANWGTTASNQLFGREVQDNNAVLVKAIGTESNTSAIGAVVKIKTGDKVQMDQITGATGYASQSSLVLHFGVGRFEIIDEMTIEWPSGAIDVYTDLSVNRRFTATENEGIQDVPLSNTIITSIDNSEPEQVLTNFPNPFSDRTFIPVQSSLPNQTRIEVYTLGGEKIQTLEEIDFINEQPGFYWYGDNASGYSVKDGMYLYKVYSKGKGVLRTGKLIYGK